MSRSSGELSKEMKEVAYILERIILDNEIIEGVTDCETVWNFIRTHMSTQLKNYFKRKLSSNWFEKVKNKKVTAVLEQDDKVLLFESYRKEIRQTLKSSNRLEPLPGFKTKYVSGDRVMVPWMKGQNLENWYRGTIKGHSVVASSKYGEIRNYHVMFDDGDEDTALSEEYVWSIDEYRIATDEKIKQIMEKKGIHEYHLDGDPYTQRKGFFKLEKYTAQKIYGSIIDVLRAHDDAYVERHDPSVIQREDLLLPNEWNFSNNQISRYQSQNEQCHSDVSISSSTGSSCTSLSSSCESIKL